MLRERSRVGQYEWHVAESFDAGFYRNAESGRVIPQFLPLWPAWLALMLCVAGLRGALLLPALCAAGGLFFVHRVARFAFGSAAALVALAMLALSPVELWFARETLVAVPAQMLAFSALYAALLWEEERRMSHLVLAAALVGLSLTMQIMAFIWLPGLLAWSVHRRAHAFTVGLAASAAAAIGLDVWASPTYVGNTAAQSVFFLPQALRQGAAPVLVLGVALAGAAAIPLVLRRARPPAIAVMTATALWFYAAWLVLLRPPTFLTVALHSEDATNVLQLCWYVTTLVPALAFGGLLCTVRAAISRAELALLLWLGLDPLVLLYNNFVENVHPWLLKRYIVATIPVMILLAARSLAALLRGRGWRRALGAAAVVYVTTAPLVARKAMAFLPQLRGALSTLQHVDDALPTNACVLLEGGATTLAAPLWLIFDRPSLVLWGTTGEERLTVRSALERLQREGLVPFVLSDEPGGLDNGSTAEISFDLATLRQAKDAPVSAIQSYHTRLHLTRVPALDGQPIPARIEVGTDDYGLVFGAHPPERSADGRVMRWTGHQLQAWVRRSGDALCLTVGGYRPPGASAARMTVSVGDLLLASDMVVQPPLTEVSLPLPTGTPAILPVMLRASTFVPALVANSGDTRELGLMVAEIRCE